MSKQLSNTFIGIATTILQQDQAALVTQLGPEGFGARVLAELARTFAVRVVEEQQGQVQVTRRPELHETEFRLELFVFNQSQLDAYYEERKDRENAPSSRLDHNQLTLDLEVKS